jgi:group I intron endonuclease
MNIIIENNSVLEKSGIYKIKNIVTQKFYIGSTIMSLYKRMQHHYCLLNTNKHKNIHLQRSWNKYGKDNFQFIAFENIEKTECLNREQVLIDEIGIDNLYNINPLASGTPNLSKETLDKRNNSIKKTREICVNYKKQILNKEITIDEIPIKYLKWTSELLRLNNRVTWNKGKKQGEIDYSHLKGVKKTITEKWHKRTENARNTVMAKSKEMWVYDINYNFLGYWKNAHELEKESLNDDFKLIKHMILRNPKGRNGYSAFVLKSFNTQKSIRKNTSYKGLFFKCEPLHQEIDVEKLGKNGED